MSPQPQPTGGAGDCWQELIDALPAWHPMRTACVERRTLGAERYGQVLRRGDGRDEVRDLVEELLDGAVYAQRLRRYMLAHLLLWIAAYVRRGGAGPAPPTQPPR